MGFTISFDDNSANNLSRQIRRKMFEIGEQRIREVAGGLTCPEHHQYATVVCEATTDTKMSFRVSGCCDSFIASVSEALGRM
jgi:hypothetical protein